METIAQRWWLFALRGVAAILFGILTFVAPIASVFALVILFGAYAFVDGALSLVLAVRGDERAREHRGWLAFEGIVGLATGVVAFIWPTMTALALLMVIAAWAVV